MSVYICIQFTLLKITTIQQTVNGYESKQVFNSVSKLLWARKFKVVSYAIELLIGHPTKGKQKREKYSYIQT